MILVVGVAVGIAVLVHGNQLPLDQNLDGFLERRLFDAGILNDFLVRGPAVLKSISEAMKAYMLTHPFDSGNSDCQTVLDQLYHAYAESHEHDPQEIGDGFKELEEYLCVLPLDNNNAVFNLCCRLCSAYERKAFLDGLQYGAELMLELGKESDR